MRRPDKTGGKAAKTQRRKTLRRRNTAKVARRRESSAVDTTEWIAQLTRERDEALQRQTATADVLKVISASPGELEPVFEAMLENAMRICEAKFGHLLLYDGKSFHAAHLYNVPPSYRAIWERGPIRPSPNTGLGRLARTKQVIHIPDIKADLAYVERDSLRVATVELAGARTFLSVPMLKENKLVGAIVIYRQEVRSFTEKQIELVTNFATQAVIAIENTRLLNELRLRTNDLTEALEQQTATSEVLKVIASSRGELEPVFNAMLANATRLCEAQFGNLFLRDDSKFRPVAIHNKEMYDAYLQRNPVIDLRDNPGIPLDRLNRTKQVVHISDLRTDQSYIGKNAFIVPLVEVVGARAFVAVPMIKQGELIGAINMYRQEVRPFTDKQIELVSNFAAQAVIAIENARLLNELRERTHELAASLDSLRTTQDRLVQTQKLASLGQLTAGIAHEIKNPLNFVNNFSGVSAELVDELREAMKDLNPNEKGRSDITELMDTLRSNLDKVVQHGKRADAIVKNMLLHSHQGSGEHRPVAINTIVEESLKLAYHGARAEKQNFNIIVEQSLDPLAGEVDVFPQEITRVLLNLISNGVYATREKVLPDGETYRPTLTASTKNLGDRVEVRIRDNGAGISPEVKDKMFNPFFTTKPAGEGTGLGLSISHDIVVKQHGGSIEVDTQPGKFTEVRIILPRTAVSIPSKP
jgi:signal transduction histidine kinase/DNA-binding FrmR family transcriptional regulator